MTQSRRNHFRLLFAVTTWGIIASALAWGNLSASGFGGLGAGWFTADEDWYLEHYGWPAQYRLRSTTVTTFGMVVQGKRIGPKSVSVRGKWRVRGLMVDTSAALFILISTALVLEKWLRGVRLTRLSLKTMMIMIAVIAILLALYRARDEFDGMMPQHFAARHV